jgi:hypothetical protein
MSVDPINTKSALQKVSMFLAMEPSFTSLMNPSVFRLNNLTDTCHTALRKASILGSEMDELFLAWNLLTPDISSTSAEIVFRKLLIAITATTRATREFRQSAISLYVAANKSVEGLDEYLASLHKNISQAKNKLTECEAALHKTRIAIHKLKKELSGSSGFWKGFAQGITDGIYHPVNDNLVRQRELYESYLQEQNKLSKNVRQQEAEMLMLHQGQAVLSHVQGLDSSTVSLENAVLRISTLASETQHDNERAIATNGNHVAAFFQNRFKEDMSELVTWRDVF